MSLLEHVVAAGEAYVTEQVSAATEPLNLILAAQFGRVSELEQARATDAATIEAGTVTITALEQENTAAAATIDTLTARVFELEAPITTEPRLTLVGEPGKVHKITTPGVYRNLAIAGTLQIGCDNVWVDQFEILWGDPINPYPTMSRYGVWMNSYSSNTKLSNGKIHAPQHPNNGIGVMALGASLVTENLEISGVFDGFHIGTGDWTDYHSYVHELNWLERDLHFATGGSHPDGAQLQAGGRKVKLYGTKMSTGPNPNVYGCIMATNDKGPLAAFQAYNVTLEGGRAPINFAGTGIPILEILDSRIGYSSILLGGRYSAGLMKSEQKAVARFDGTTMIDGKPLDISNG